MEACRRVSAGECWNAYLVAGGPASNWSATKPLACLWHRGVQRAPELWANAGPARAAIDGELARLCPSCSPRVDAAGRVEVRVRAGCCANCGGSRNARGIAEMDAACAAAGIRRLVVVGGSPDVRRELGASRLELRLIDGIERRTRAQADGDLSWADLVVIAGSSELAHRVSALYTKTRKPGPPVITAARRGVEAITAAVVEHARRR